MRLHGSRLAFACIYDTTILSVVTFVVFTFLSVVVTFVMLTFLSVVVIFVVLTFLSVLITSVVFTFSSVFVTSLFLLSVFSSPSFSCVMIPSLYFTPAAAKLSPLKRAQLHGRFT